MFKLQFETDNAAFDEGNERLETARILRELADRIETGMQYGPVYDFNGNKVGTAGFD